MSPHTVRSKQWSCACITLSSSLLFQTEGRSASLRVRLPRSNPRRTHWANGGLLVAVVDASDKEHPENWKFQVYYGWKGRPYAADFKTEQDRLHFFRQNVSRFCEPWRTAVLALPEDEIIPVDPGAQFSPYHWDNRSGRVTLAGDAAHSMLPRKTFVLLNY